MIHLFPLRNETVDRLAQFALRRVREGLDQFLHRLCLVVVHVGNVDEPEEPTTEPIEVASDLSLVLRVEELDGRCRHSLRGLG